jgi:DNA repair protein RadC
MQLHDKQHWLDPDEKPTKDGKHRKPTLASRVVTDGATRLDDAELLQLVLGDKTRGNIADLLHAEPAELVASALLSEVQAAKLAGAFELCRRFGQHRDTQPRLTTATAIWNWVRPSLSGLRREVFRVLCIDARNRLLRDVKAAEGSVDSCHVDPREVFGPAVACRASAVVLVHNHPSGNSEPSDQDVQLTQQLQRAGELLCIRVIDHLVVSESSFVSMAARRLL